jgi:putative transposase
VDRDNQTLGFMLSKRINLGAAHCFFKKAIASNGVPQKIVIDKSGANLVGAQSVNAILKITGPDKVTEILQARYLNNIPEQDHRVTKRITKHMVGFKAFHSASATITSMQVAHRIRKNQFANDNHSPFEVFVARAA